MFTILCDNCKNPVDFDYNTSINEYLHKVDYINDSDDFILDTAMSTGLVYRCINCKKTYKYTFRDLELKRRESIRADVRRYRKIYVFKNIINPGSVNPDNGLFECNLCDGVDNLGNCYKDIIAVCPFANKHEA